MNWYFRLEEGIAYNQRRHFRNICRKNDFQHGRNALITKKQKDWCKQSIRFLCLFPTFIRKRFLPKSFIKYTCLNHTQKRVCNWFLNCKNFGIWLLPYKFWDGSLSKFSLKLGLNLSITILFDPWNQNYFGNKFGCANWHLFIFSCYG